MPLGPEFPPPPPAQLGADSADPRLPPPPKQGTSTSSVVTVPDGFTVILGGIEQEVDTEGESRVPFLASIPLLGQFFRSRSTTKTKSRFYVFLRCNVLRSQTFEDLKYLSRAPKEQAEIDEDPSTAEELLREALATDLFHGPAHNNLGVVFLAQGKLYEAAGEFEWARKLMPGHPDPRVNLALTLERAEKTDDALAAYTAALEVHPGYLPAIMGAASLTARTGREDERLTGWIEEIAMRAEDEVWAEWARERLAISSR